ncbi:MSHA biogenesis protein MshI [Vibrio comitans NBRC 102076]|uniref:MSHA biogenesis protein MshI n=1 Tax=Vibrio comitans NBRC 102076 TaxID=1219078 RepID=A0A4Y3ITT8_9VIBR|nr:MSHA biogenesis protein MshI [Vibrio comitans NBRC 102076]
MTWLSSLKKLTSSKDDDFQLIIVIQTDAVYLSELSHPEKAPELFPIAHGNWESALKESLSSKSVKGKACVVFGAQHYQSYQIDKPQLPKEEWPVALPFLLKDLITEKFSDIVADGSLMPDGQKVQAYVMAKRTLQTLLEVSTANDVDVTRVITEDEVWGHSATEQQSFLLLRRCVNDGYKLAAYVDGTPVFNRSLRGIVAPITGENGTSLMYDSLALDIQRSADYLAASMPQSSFRQLLVCCDEDNIEELMTRLQDSVNPKISALSEPHLPCGIALCKTVAELTSFSINLYPEHLRPKQELLNLNKVVALWVVTVVAIGGLTYLEKTQTADLQQKLVSVKSQSELLNREKSSLQQRLASHTPTQSKVNAAKRIEQDIEAKRSSLKAVGQFDDSQKVGYSGIMVALSEQARNDISLQHIVITSTRLDLSGIASEPAAVPSWVNQFKQELALVGRTFESLNIGRDKDNVVTFELKAKAGVK